MRALPKCRRPLGEGAKRKQQGDGAEPEALCLKLSAVALVNQDRSGCQSVLALLLRPNLLVSRLTAFP